MDQNKVYFNEISTPNQRDEILIGSEITGWQPSSTPNKLQMQKQFVNSLVRQSAQTKRYIMYENGLQAIPEEQNQRLTPFSNIQTAERSENIVNTDFLSAIPNARQSKTVKRKLSYDDERLERAIEIDSKPKTYFPFEFIGRATRQSVTLNDSGVVSKESENRLNPRMVTGHALRKSDVNGSIYHTSFTSQSETPLAPRKRARTFSSKKKSNSSVALEQHFEQIRRKHAEFNWEVPDSQSTLYDELSSTDVDIQRVPTTPFFEQYAAASPSLYSAIAETPGQNTMSWMPVPASSFGLDMQSSEQRSQKFAAEDHSNNKSWSTNISRMQEFPGNPSTATNEVRLYPY